MLCRSIWIYRTLARSCNASKSTVNVVRSANCHFVSQHRMLSNDTPSGSITNKNDNVPADANNSEIDKNLQYRINELKLEVSSLQDS